MLFIPCCSLAILLSVSNTAVGMKAQTEQRESSKTLGMMKLKTILKSLITVPNSKGEKVLKGIKGLAILYGAVLLGRHVYKDLYPVLRTGKNKVQNCFGGGKKEEKKEKTKKDVPEKKKEEIKGELEKQQPKKGIFPFSYFLNKS